MTLTHVNCESNINTMRLQLPVIVTLIICVSISACNQEGCTDILAVNYSNNATIENGSCIYPFYAGAIEHGGVILELENPLEMSFVWDEESLYGFAELFLDLDADGNPDLNFSATTYNNDSLESILQSGLPCTEPAVEFVVFVAPPGLEPGMSGPKPGVLPLHHGAKACAKIAKRK